MFNGKDIICYKMRKMLMSEFDSTIRNEMIKINKYDGE